MTDPAPTDEQIAEWVALAEAATPGPWHANPPGQCCRNACVTNAKCDGPIHDSEDIAYRDQAFIAAARTAVPALAAALESTRAELAAQRMRAEVAEARCWAVRPGSRAGDIECCLRRGHDGDHWATTGCAGSEITWPRIEAELAAERAKVQESARKAAEFVADAYHRTAQILGDRADTTDPQLTALAPGMRASAIVLRDAADGFLAQARAALAAAQPTGKTP